MTKRSDISAVLKLIFLSAILIAAVSINGVGQKTEHYNSPLYSPKTYDPTQGSTSNGIPTALKTVGIEQKLNSPLPLETEFQNENGETVKLGNYFNRGRPVILALVYFECPMLCNEVLNGLTGSLKGISFDAGKDYDVVAISFDARENGKTELKQKKKEGYLARYGRAGAADGFHFLTGSQESIDAVTNAVGFTFHFDEATQQFAHAGGIMIATPGGKLSRYFYGIDYSPKDLKFGLMESSEGKIGNPVEQLYLYCYHYDPSTGKYGLTILNVLRLAGIATMLGIAGMLFGFWRYNRKKKAMV